MATLPSEAFAAKHQALNTSWVEQVNLAYTCYRLLVDAVFFITGQIIIT